MKIVRNKPNFLEGFCSPGTQKDLLVDYVCTIELQLSYR